MNISLVDEYPSKLYLKCLKVPTECLPVITSNRDGCNAAVETGKNLLEHLMY